MVKITQNSFFGGQLDYEMMGRQDFQRYYKGASRLKNFNILKRGGLDKRRGFDRVVDLCKVLGIGASDKIRLVPFAYKKGVGFVLVFTPKGITAMFVSGGNVYTMYNVVRSGTTSAVVIYAAYEIDEIDYQQCGDVMFIAHQKHPPAKITHSLAPNGEHVFEYEECEFNIQDAGIPKVSGASVARKGGVDLSGGTKTEYYKATAVFDDGETLPSASYSRDMLPTAKGTVDKTIDYASTSYYLPWTDSQKIRVSVVIQKRMDKKSGMYVYPNEVRLYKKAYNYFGLVASARISYGSEYATISQGAIPTYVTVSDVTYGQEQADIFEQWDKVGPMGLGHGGRTFVNTSATYSRDIKFQWTGSANDGTARIGFGSIGYDTYDAGGQITSSQDDASYAVVKLHGNTIGKVDILGAASVTGMALPTFDDRSERIDREQDEPYGDFISRVESLASDMAASVPEGTDITIALTSASNYITIRIPKGDEGVLSINNVAVAKVASLTVDGGASMSSGTLTFTDNYITPDASITPPSRPDSKFFVGAGNYPGAVSLTQQRLVWASTINDPARIWMSEVGDFYTYNQHEIQTPSDAIDFILPVTRFPRINHIVEMRKLLMFNSACEWMVESASSNSGITYETIQAYPQSYSGSNERLKPIVCNNSVVFCERSGQSVRRFAWDLASDGFAGRDVSVLSCSIFEDNPIIDWTYQQFPFSTLWCALYDGTMASFEFMEEQDIIAWGTHEIGHGPKCGVKVASVSSSCALSPHIDEITSYGTGSKYDSATHEEVFAAVRRGHYENGEFVADTLWIERMRPRPRIGNAQSVTETVYHSLCMDSVRVLNSKNHDTPMDWDAASGTWMNLDVNDGLVYIDRSTSDGVPISRDRAIEIITAGGDYEIYEGYPFTAEFQSVFPSVSRSIVGVGQMDIKEIGNVGLRLIASYGGTVRATGCNETEPIRYDDDPGEIKTPVFGNGMATFKNLDAANVKPVGINTRDGRFHVEQSDPWPFSMTMFEVDVEVEKPTGA